MADVLEAVTYVAGVDPLTEGRTKSVAASRLLAVHALREITECSTPEIAAALGYAGHTTPLRRLSTPVDKFELQAVAVRVITRPRRGTTPRKGGLPVLHAPKMLADLPEHQHLTS